MISQWDLPARRVSWWERVLRRDPGTERCKKTEMHSDPVAKKDHQNDRILQWDLGAKRAGSRWGQAAKKGREKAQVRGERELRKRWLHGGIGLREIHGSARSGIEVQEKDWGARGFGRKPEDQNEAFSRWDLPVRRVALRWDRAAIKYRDKAYICGGMWLRKTSARGGIWLRERAPKRQKFAAGCGCVKRQLAVGSGCEKAHRNDRFSWRDAAA
ncbi:hypothetical protein C8R43DRAFT_957507 [Mycena crocata]|nr:hypothetical protein C8R43DRAFT_957507 [Mycena crocata]